MPSSESESLTNKTIRGLESLLIGAGAQTAIQLLVIGILARVVTPAEFGLMGAATVVVGFASIAAQSGIGPAVVQRASLTSQHVRVGFAISVLFGLVSCMAVLFAAPLISQFFRMPELELIVRIVSLIPVIAGVSLVFEALLQREMQFRQLALISVTSYALGYGTIGIILALAGCGVWALVGAHLGQVTVRSFLVLLTKHETFRLPAWAWSEAKQLLGFGFGHSLSQVSNQLAIQGDNLVVGRLLGAESLGAYGRAFQSAAMPANLFGSVIDTVLFPTLASVQTDKARLGRGFIRALAACAAVMLPVSLMLFILAPELIAILFGPQWNTAITPFRLLALALLFRTSYKICDALVRATGAVYRQAWRHSAYAAAVIVGAWAGQFWGLNGVAMGVTLAILLQSLMMIQLSLALSGANWRDVARAHIAPLILAFLLGWPLQLLAEGARAYQFSPLLILLGITATAVGAYLLLLRCFPRVLGKEAVWLADQLALRYRSFRGGSPEASRGA